MVRTRVGAQELAASGHVRLNGERTRTPGRPVRIGDVLTVALEGGRVRVLEVKGFAERRGGASEAAPLYVERTTAAGDSVTPSLAPAGRLR